MWLVDVHAVTSLPHCGLVDLCKSLSRNKTIHKLELAGLELIECNDDGNVHIAHLMTKNST